MTKITKKNFSKNLAKYGALSVAIAGVADATGQVVYTDVDPDFVGGMTDSFAIDFDEDGTDDVTILQSNNGNYELVQANAVDNGVARFDAGNSYVYASNLAEGAAIDASLTFASFGSLCAGPGYNGSQFCGTGPSFVGIEFEAGGGTTHYAWVRVDVADSGNFQVLDYAFESTPDTAINAGDTGPIAGVEDQVFNGFEYFVNNNVLNLSANNTMEKISLYNVLGQEVLSQRLQNTNETINLSSMKTGVYIARVEIEGVAKSIKIAIK